MGLEPVSKLYKKEMYKGRSFFCSNLVFCISLPAKVKCQPPVIRISISKDPFNAQLVPFDSSNFRDTFTVTAILDPDCNITKMILYSWEITFVDRETGMFNQIYQYGKFQRKKNEVHLWKKFIRRPGLQYIRCIARIAEQPGVYLLTYDFGFFEIVPMEPLKCEVTSSQGMSTLDKFTLRCKGGYKDKQAIGYTVRMLDSSDAILVLSEWGFPNGTLTVPAVHGSPMEDYNVRVEVEAKYLSMPSLIDDVVVKVG